MGEGLPGVPPSSRIEITEDDLVASAPPSSPDAAPSSDTLKPARPPHPGAFCSTCGNPIHPNAMVCPSCGVATAGAAHVAGAAVSVAMGAKSAGVAVLLSLVFTGAGHWYVGRVGRGFVFFGLAFVSALLIVAVIGLIMLPVIWICAAIDASRCAQEHNRRLLSEATGGFARPTLPS